MYDDPQEINLGNNRPKNLIRDIRGYLLFISDCTDTKIDKFSIIRYHLLKSDSLIIK